MSQETLDARKWLTKHVESKTAFEVISEAHTTTLNAQTILALCLDKKSLSKEQHNSMMHAIACLNNALSSLQKAKLKMEGTDDGNNSPDLSALQSSSGAQTSP